jgi:hypothetical protein
MRSLHVKLVLCAALAVTALAAMPSVASAHYLGNRDANRTARLACQDITRSESTPYVCRGILARQRRSAHAVSYLLDLYDPNDGEECSAIVRIFIKAGSRRIRGKITDSDCAGPVSFS